MINFVKTENAFNKILKKGIKDSENVSILFTSSYDKSSQAILKEILDGNHSIAGELNVVDSFETPHAFVACNTSQVPCLININNRKKNIEYYLPFIYEKLGVSLP
jgi:hypothetical protein